MSDSRDTNHDGHVSLSEKIKDKLHLHRKHKKDKKDKKGTRTSSSTGHSGFPVAQPANHTAASSSHTAASGYTAASHTAASGSHTAASSSHTLNQGHRLSTGEKLAGTTGALGAGALGAGALGAAGAGASGSGFDSRDLNRDGHVSATEKLQTSAGDSSSSSDFNHSGHSTVFHDSRDLNRDGHVSATEKLQTSAGASGSGFDSRDLNRDGHVSATEKLQTSAGDSSSGHSTVFHDSRDLNRDGDVSMVERLEANMGMEGEETRLRLHEEQLAVSKRAVSAGAVEIVKRVHEEQVQYSVPVIRQEIVMERRPYSGDDSSRVPEKDEVARVILYREEVVTRKVIVPMEEVVVRKDVLTDHHTVGAVLRSEYIETSQVEAATSGTYGYAGDVSPKKLKSDDNVYMKVR